MKELTKRERTVLSWASHGLTENEIADRCDVSHSTIKNHLTNIRQKLNAENTAHAVAIAIRECIIS